jgi:hypothetical protein
VRTSEMSALSWSMMSLYSLSFSHLAAATAALTPRTASCACMGITRVGSMTCQHLDCPACLCTAMMHEIPPDWATAHLTDAWHQSTSGQTVAVCRVAVHAKHAGASPCARSARGLREQGQPGQTNIRSAEALTAWSLRTCSAVDACAATCSSAALAAAAWAAK